MDSYRKQQWIVYREQVLALDEYECSRCGRSRASGAVLQVHHKHYLPGRAPWEYPLESCETLCKGCHASEHGKIRPEHGWEFVGEDDLGGLYETCERCGTEIRYANFIQHPHWEPMVVGTVCCDDLTGTETASKLRRKRDRLKRFCSSTRWVQEGNEYSITQKRFKIRIIKEANGYRLQIHNICGHVYPTALEAMHRAFEFIDSGEAKRYFSGSTK